jgi:hypothetical protein
MFEAVVHIACLCMLAVDPCDIMRAELVREVMDESARAIVENENAKIGMVDCHRGDDRAFEDGGRLVVGGDEHIHRRGEEGRALRGVGIRGSVLVRDRKKQTIAELRLFMASKKKNIQAQTC